MQRGGEVTEMVQELSFRLKINKRREGMGDLWGAFGQLVGFQS